MNKQPFNILEWRNNHLKGENRKTLTEDKVEPRHALNVLNKKLTEIGFKALKKLPVTGKPTNLEKGKIDPKKLGLFGNAFSAIQYEVKVYFNEDQLDQFVRIMLNFSYQHPGGGSNGVTLTWRWDSYKTKWDLYS